MINDIAEKIYLVVILKTKNENRIICKIKNLILFLERFKKNSSALGRVIVLSHL